MKRKLLYTVILAALLLLALVVSVSAESKLNAQTSNSYGELSFFDESISVGRTESANTFTPYMADGVNYARVVIGDGSTFYTFPTYYILSKNGGERNNNPLFQHNFASLNSAMEAATGTNPNWNKSNVYRIELPARMERLNGGDQNFYGFSNVIEIYLQPNTTTIDSPNCLFHTCKKLEVIHNIESFVFKAKTLEAAFQNCESLTTITLGVNTSITATANSIFNGCKKLESVNLLEAFPNLTTISQSSFNNCKSLKTISTSGVDYILVLPEGITKVDSSAFYECDTLKYVSLPSTLTHLGSTSFHGCDSLEFVNFNNNTNTITINGWGAFYKCTSLKAVSLPANMTDIKERTFNGCTSLEAVCLPANLVSIQSNGNGQGTFDNNSKMYFVSESFDVGVCFQDGVYDSTKFTMPEKQSVYYMPQSFTRFYGHVINGGLGSEVGSFFNKCTSLNETIVFSTSFVNINTCNLFTNMGTKSSPKNVVFLGDIEACVNFQNTTYTNIIFANSNDKSPKDLGFVKYYQDSNNSNSYLYFCVAGTKYSFAIPKANLSADANVNLATIVASVANEAKHVFEKSMETEASCELPKMTADYCFCGQYIVGSEKTEGVALGHKYEGAVSYEFTSLTTQGAKYIVCTNNCGKPKVEEVGAVYTALGYSAKTFGKYSFVSGYDVNTESLAIYEKTKGVTLSFGFAFNTASTFTDGEVTLDSFKIVAPVTGASGDTTFSFYQYAISYETEENLDTDIVIAAYVIEKSENSENLTFINRADGEVNGFEAISYNKALALAEQ